jgi:hypothetical protein
MRDKLWESHLFSVLPHNHKKLPPLWRLKEVLELTDEHPSGLRIRKNGRFVTRKHKQSGFYVVSVDNEPFLAHRIVYYMRTSECPDPYCVKHVRPDVDLDNRNELIAVYTKRKKTDKPVWNQDNG